MTLTKYLLKVLFFNITIAFSLLAQAQVIPDLIEFSYEGDTNPQPSLELSVQSATRHLMNKHNSDGVYNFYNFSGGLFTSLYKPVNGPFVKNNGRLYSTVDYGFAALPWKNTLTQFIYVLDDDNPETDRVLSANDPCSSFGSDFKFYSEEHNSHQFSITQGSCVSLIREMSYSTIKQGAECPSDFPNAAFNNFMFDARAFYIASGRSTNNHSEDIYPTAGIFRAARKYWNALKDTTCGKPIPVFNITQYNRYCGIHYVSPSPDAYPDEDTPSARTDLSRVDAELADGIRCLQQDVARAGGQAIVTSAYRSPAYQSHLRSVWDQFDSIQMRYRYPECTVETTKIRREFRNHGLLTTQRPASASGPHTLGNAVDVAVSLPPESNIDEIAENCGVYRRLPVNDPVHFELIRNENED